MPLVSRTSLQGNFFQEDTEPPNWQNADLWADTNASPRALFINNAGTARELGSASADVDDNDLTAVGAAAQLDQLSVQFNHSTSFQVRTSATVTPSNATNIVILAGCCVMKGRGGSQTWTLEISEGGTERVTAVTSTFDTIATDLGLNILGVLTDEAAEASTYDVRTKSSAANQIGLGPCSIFCQVIDS